jgi:hypothetical protein
MKAQLFKELMKKLAAGAGYAGMGAAPIAMLADKQGEEKADPQIEALKARKAQMDMSKIKRGLAIDPESVVSEQDMDNRSPAVVGEDFELEGLEDDSKLGEQESEDSLEQSPLQEGMLDQMDSTSPIDEEKKEQLRQMLKTLMR